MPPSLLQHAQILEADRLHARLGAAGVPALFLKGAAFAGTLYVEARARPMNDVDLLVHRADLPRAAAVLKTEGYDRLVTTGRIISADQYYAWIFTNRWMRIDLHADLFPHGWFNIEPAGLWQRAVVRDGQGRGVPTLSAEDTVVHLAVHLIKDGLRQPEKLRADLDAVISHWQPNWSLVADIARAWGAETCLWLAAQHAPSLRAASIELPSRWRRWVLQRLGAQPHHGAKLAILWLVCARALPSAVGAVGVYAVKRGRDLFAG